MPGSGHHYQNISKVSTWKGGIFRMAIVLQWNCYKGGYLWSGDLTRRLVRCSEVLVMPMRVLAVDITESRCCVVSVLDINQWLIEADVTAGLSGWYLLCQPGNSSDIWPPRDIIPKENGTLGESSPSLFTESLSRSGSRPQACRQDRKSWATLATWLGSTSSWIDIWNEEIYWKFLYFKNIFIRVI